MEGMEEEVRWRWQWWSRRRWWWQWQWRIVACIFFFFDASSDRHDVSCALHFEYATTTFFHTEVSAFANFSDTILRIVYLRDCGWVASENCAEQLRAPRIARRELRARRTSRG